MSVQGEGQHPRDLRANTRMLVQLAARRLLIVMLLFLAISTLAAALVPPPPSGDEPADTTTGPTSAQAPPGRLVRATLDARARSPETVDLELGDQLSLSVRSNRTIAVEVTGLGLLENAARLSPARFDILARRTGTFTVRSIDPRARIGTIEVSDAADAPGR